ncbi:MAG TPA: sulfatase-like hydrolase/transferase [Conexibacter sp.]|jgi:arylsulfatase A-like enzyme
MGSQITRRSLLRGGGAHLAGAAAVGAAGPALLRTATADAATTRAEQRKNVVVIVADRMRADFVGVYADDYDNTTPAKTPNLDAFAKESLRFKHSVPESMPAVPMRNGLLTGVRSFPFRDWKATPGMPAIPGWNGVYDYLPLMPELLQQHDVNTLYVTNNPLLTGPRSAPWARPTRRLPTSADHTATQRSYFQPLRRMAARVDPTPEVMARGVRALDRLKGRQPFFLALDAFDPDEVFQQPIAYVTGPVADRIDHTSGVPADHYDYGQLVSVDVDDATREEVRSRYADEVAAADRAIGDVLNKLHDLRLDESTLVFVLGDCGIALGEQGVFGYPTGVYHRRVYEVPHMIRDPHGRRSGDESGFFASSHDVAPTVLSWFGVTIPGRMAGEDLNVMLDDDDFREPSRPYFTTGLDLQVVVGDTRYLLHGEIVRSHRRLYETNTSDDPEDITFRTETKPTVLESLWRHALNAAGGTLPDFSSTAAIRPKRERDDNQVPQDGTLTDSDEVDAQKLSQTGG